MALRMSLGSPDPFANFGAPAISSIEKIAMPASSRVFTLAGANEVGHFAKSS